MPNEGLETGPKLGSQPALPDRERDFYVVREFVVQSVNDTLVGNRHPNGLPFDSKRIESMWLTSSQYAADSFGSADLSIKWQIANFLWIRKDGSLDVDLIRRKLVTDQDLEPNCRWRARLQWYEKPGNQIGLAWEIGMNRNLVDANEFFAVLVHEMDHVAYVFRMLRQFGIKAIDSDPDLHYYKTEFFARYHGAEFMMGNQEMLNLDWDTLFRWTGSEHDPKHGLYDRSASYAVRAISARNAIWSLLRKKYGSSRKNFLNEEGQFYFNQVVREMEEFLFAIFNIQGLEAFIQHLEWSAKNRNLANVFMALSNPENSPELLAKNPFFQSFQAKIAHLSSSF